MLLTDWLLLVAKIRGNSASALLARPLLFDTGKEVHVISEDAPPDLKTKPVAGSVLWRSSC